MSGIRLWRCSRCEQAAVVAVEQTRLFCGQCFYLQTVERVMAAAFASDSPPPSHKRSVAENRPPSPR